MGGGLIWWGVALILIGLLLGLTGGFGVGGALVSIGWLLVVVGVVLAIVFAITGAARRPA